MSEEADLRIEIIELKAQVARLKADLQMERSNNESIRQHARGMSSDDAVYEPTEADLEDPDNAAGSIIIPRSVAVRVLVALQRARNHREDRLLITSETIQCAALWIHRLLDELDGKAK